MFLSDLSVISHKRLSPSESSPGECYDQYLVIQHTNKYIVKHAKREATQVQGKHRPNVCDPYTQVPERAKVAKVIPTFIHQSND